MNIDEQFMRRALNLAEQGRGYTAPNPMVGAVLIKGNQVIGEGFHQIYGGPHAEAMALSTAVASPEGATMYCTLEPCTPAIPGKKTPPCSERLLREGIARLVIASLDPHPNVNGLGVEMLRSNGMSVDTGCLADQAIKLNEVYMKFCQTGRPFVHLKWASTLDGKIATMTGDSQWISDIDARTEVHRLRHHYDAVLVGVNTVIQDNPQLTVRHLEGRQPRRIIVDSKLRIPEDAAVLTDKFRDRTVVFCSAAADSVKKCRLINLGIQVESVASDTDGRVSLPHLLQTLAQQNISSVMVEGGREILTAFIAGKLFDKVTAYLAPVLIGKGISAIGDLHIRQISEGLKLENLTIRTLNQQLVIEGYQHCRNTFGIMTEQLLCLQE